MKVGKIYLMLFVGVGMALASCGNSQNKKNESPVVGSDKDEHGCIASAGYCIRLWEKGVRMESVADKENTAYIVFAPDSLQVELFFSGDQPNEILDRRSLPGGDYAWNVEDDDTKNVRQENGRWTISQRGNLIYQQVDEIQ